MHSIFLNTNISNNLYYEKIYKRGDIIFNEGDECTKVGFVEYGNISITTISYSNNEYEIKSLGNNSFFGAFVLFSNKPFYLGTAIASTNTKVIFFTKQNLLQAFNDKNFLINYLNLTTKESLLTQQKIKLLSQASIRDKILFLLHENKNRNNTNVYRIKSKELLSKMINCPRPSLSRVLIELKEEGIIDYNRYEIILL